MRFNRFVITGLAVVSQQGFADECNNVCADEAGLCDKVKGSWCNGSGNCQNLMVLTNRELCYVSPSQSCSGGQPLKCGDASSSVAAHRRASFQKAAIQRIRDETAKRGPRPIRFAPDYEPNKGWGDTGCTIAWVQWFLIMYRQEFTNSFFYLSSVGLSFW